MKQYSVDTTTGNPYAPWGVYENEEGGARKRLFCQALEREDAERVARLLWAERLIDLLAQQKDRLRELP